MVKNALDLRNQRFGMLIAVSRTSEKEKGYFLWDCQCDCGNRVKVSTKKLKRGTITDCGCKPKKTARNGTIAEDISGQHFGKLTAVSRVESKYGKTRWLCNCECGGTCIAITAALKSGYTWHCGCMIGKNRNTTMLDLYGKRFGRLLPVRVTNKRDSKGSVIWECLCDCGNKVEVSADCLVHGNTVSCGCKKREIQNSVREYLTFVDGTCVEWLRSRKHRIDNTSGFRGVNKTANGKWCASIGFKRKRYYLGYYDSFEEAKEVRLDAERKLHDTFISIWEKWSVTAACNPEWAVENPFAFDVYKDNGELIVSAPVLNDLVETNKVEISNEDD